MGSDLADHYAPRQEYLEALFKSLPPAGTPAYWERIEQASEEEALPLEVLAMCLRERLDAGKKGDVHRLFTVMVGRLDELMTAWAKKIARQANGSRREDLVSELTQEGVLDLWAHLAGEGNTFLTVNFLHGLMRVQQHTAYRVMQQQGYWKRKEVVKTNRVPTRQIDSLEAGRRTGDGEVVPYALPDHSATDAYNQAEDREDVAEAIRGLAPKDRYIIHQAFYEGQTQDEIARALGITDRAVRARLKKIYALLRQSLREE